jgi:putative transposase
MPSSYCYLATHIIFSTDQRAYHLNDIKQKEMYTYMAGIIINIKGKPILINGTEDHIHILCLLPKEMCISDFIRNIKAFSSKWYNEKYHSNFHWQTGYAAYAVSKSNMNAVEQYIQNQKEHHRVHTFQEEYDKFLKMHGFEAYLAK